MKYYSYAKINLGLDVVNRRDDGYHNIKTIMQRISLADILHIEKSDEIKLTCSVDYLPTDETNLVYKAIKVFSEEMGKDCPLSVHIQKRIPTQAGLGGGSSNGAVTLMALNEIYEANLDKETLSRLALKLGADVPFFLAPATSMCEGIGEIISPVDEKFPNYYVMVIKPQFSISTKGAYEEIDNIGITLRPDFDLIKQGLVEKDGEKLKKSAVNVFEEYACKVYPEIEDIKKALCDIGALVSFMSGSGSSVVGLFEKMPSKMMMPEKWRDKAYVEQFIDR